MRHSIIHRALAAFCAFALAFCLGVPALPQQASALTTANVATEAVNDSSTLASPASVMKYSGVTISKRAKIRGRSWSSWTTNATVGSAKQKGIRSLALKLEGLQGISGHIKYRTHKLGGNWKPIASDGTATAATSGVNAIKIKLTGDVAAHYDVLYRVYLSGSGWSAWTKNNATAGQTKGKKRVLAAQVKLSPKTEEACGKTTSKVGILYEARLNSTGWQKWKRDGQTAGKKDTRLRGFTVRADTGDLTGGVKFRAYSKSGGWRSWKKNGSYAAAKGNRLEAVKIKLTGALSKEYDVYYRAYVQGAGWLDWAKNGAAAGSTGYGRNLGSFQVKLVKKGGAAPGATAYPTLNKLKKSYGLNGIDISSWQAGINISKVSADFVIIKATGGTKYVNPYYSQWADAALASGKQIGFYHYAREDYCPGTAAKEAAHFVDKVGPYIGKAALFLDFERSALHMANATKWAKKFMDAVYAKTGVRPLIYMSQSVTNDYNWSAVAPVYKLWVAQYLYANMNKSGYIDNPSHWSIGYWSRETIYQYSSTAKIKGYKGSLDVNKFYGSVSDWKKLAQKG